MRSERRIGLVDTSAQLDALMGSQYVTELWGVAGRTGKRLAELSFHTICDLRDADPALIRKKFSVVLQRCVYELRGFDCIPSRPPAPSGIS